MDSVSVWDERAALQSCWFECETYPTAAYKYPSNDADFLFLTGYRDEETRAEWYQNVLFFSCLSGCRSQLKAQRWLYILIPTLSAIALFILLVCCLVCKGCPLARWCKDSRAKSAKVNPTPLPNPFLVSMAEDSTMGLGYNQLSMAKDSGYGVYKSRSYRRRASTLDRKMNNLDSTYHNPIVPSAPPAAQYNPLEPGLSLSFSGNVVGGGQGANVGAAPSRQGDGVGAIKRLATSTKRKLTGKVSRTPATSGKIKVARVS